MTRVVANRAFSVEADADRLDLRAWHETSWWRPAVAFALTFGIWAAAIMIGLWTDRLVVRAVMVLPLSVASGQLFTLAHDAGHGSYSTSRAVNALVGRLALIPSVHVYELWREHHNIHHRYTNLRSRDFVWTPLSVDEYGALSPGCARCTGSAATSRASDWGCSMRSRSGPLGCCGPADTTI